MANLKNVKRCGSQYGNTGTGDCYNDIGIPRAILFVPMDATYDASDMEAIKTAFAAAILANLAKDRMFPVQNIVAITDNTAEPTVQTFPGDGSIAITNDPAYDLSFQWLNGGFCLLHALLKSKGKNRAFMIIDSFGQLIATDAGGDLFKGIIGYNWTNKFKWSIGGDAVAGYLTRLVFLPQQVNENIVIIDFSEDGGLAYLQSLKGLQDVVISQGAARALGVLKVRAFTDCGTSDLYENYSNELTDPAAWAVVNATTLKPVPVTAVSLDSVNLGWSVTVDTASPNYAAGANGLLIGLSGPADLASIDVIGYESNKLAQ